MRKFKVKILIYIIVLLFISNCKYFTPTREEIVGEWIPVPDTPKEIKVFYSLPTVVIKKQPRLIFKDDGTLIVENMPGLILANPFEHWVGIYSGKGTWRLGEYQGSYVVFMDIDFTKGYSKYPGVETQIEVSKFFNEVSLFFWIGEEGSDRFEFVKVKNNKKNK